MQITNDIRMMRIKYFSLNLFALVLFIADRILKYYFLKNPAAKFGGDFLFGLNFHFEKNIGIAFGISMNQIILLALTIFIILILISVLVKAYQQKDLFSIFALSLIIVGAISNLLDRLHYGFVIDYINVPWFTVFNLADCMITVGVGILLIGVLINNRLDKK